MKERKRRVSGCTNGSDTVAFVSTPTVPFHFQGKATYSQKYSLKPEWVQMPSFWHGSEAQGSTSSLQMGPLYPGALMVGDETEDKKAKEKKKKG